MTIQISSGNVIVMALNVPLTLILAFFLEKKFGVLQKAFAIRKRQYLFIALPIALYTAVEVGLDCQRYTVQPIIGERNSDIAKRLYELLPQPALWLLEYCFTIVAMLVAFFFIFTVIYAVVSRMKGWAAAIYSGSTKLERRYVLFGTLAMAVFVGVVYCFTEAFYSHEAISDIFTLDSINQIIWGSFSRLDTSENDIRQAMFGLLCMPLALIAKFVSRLLFFFPGAYVFALQVLNISLMLIAAVLLLRMLDIKDKISKLAFLILYLFTYPVLLYALTIEQYVIPVFMLILTIYVCVYRKRQSVLLPALSGGAILTNFAVAPFATFNRKPLQWIKSLFFTGVTFLVICILCGKLPVLIEAAGSLVSLLERFSGIGGAEIPYDKFQQFTYFLTNCFVLPDTMITPTPHGNMSIQLAAPTAINWFGVIIGVVAVISAAVNFKRFGAKVCGLWVLFTVFVLYIIGWGSPENGMILYSLYFSWAFFALFFLLIEKLPAKIKIIKYVIYTTGLAMLIVMNTQGMRDLLNFAVTYYPVK
jgi:hypothetical protein